MRRLLLSRGPKRRQASLPDPRPLLDKPGQGATCFAVVLREEIMASHKRSFVKRDHAQTRAYSPAVITEGGRIVWLAGQTGGEDANGRSLAGDFDGQAREIFRRLGKTLEEAGGTLKDMVTMTVFITDARHGTRLTEMRREIFGDNFAASALITVTALARPELLIEIQGIAVVG
jgi:2-iminobutanoate/2-iminopropanoate deaminase